MSNLGEPSCHITPELDDSIFKDICLALIRISSLSVYFSTGEVAVLVMEALLEPPSEVGSLMPEPELS